MNREEYYMNEALIEARKAYLIDEVPIGAVIVHDNIIIARGHNSRETSKSPLAHAEIIAIENASKKLGGWRLTNCDIYVTLEPCLMCSGAIYQARLVNLYYGATDFKAGAVKSIFKVLEEPKLNHLVNINSGILKNECGEILSLFFKELRIRKKTKNLHM